MGAWMLRATARACAAQLEQRLRDLSGAGRAGGATSAGALSGGQGRMLSVAREMMTEPPLLLVDEPTVGLAPNLVEQVYGMLQHRARRRRERRSCWSSRTSSEALPLADHLYLLNLGTGEGGGAGPRFDNARVRALMQECLLG